VNLDPGELNQRIEIFRHINTPGTMGGFTRSPEKVCSTWAKVMPTKGVEVQQAERTQMVMAYTFVIRANPARPIDETMLIRWKGRDYNIRYVPDLIDRDQYQHIEAETGVAQ
jgi:SPP1 family predicted phage head-tail adaptor